MKQFPTHIVTVSGLIHNEADEVLLIRHRNGRWGWTGGQVENGENLAEALAREIMEESGLRAQVGELYAVMSNTAGYKGYGDYEYVPTKVMFAFMCRYLGGDLITSTDETSEAVWLNKNEALAHLEQPFVDIFQAYLDYDGRPTYLSYVSRPEYRLDLKMKI